MSVDFMKFGHDVFQCINSVGEHIFDYEKGVSSLFDRMTSRNNKSKGDNETSKVLSAKSAQESTVNQHAAR
ncbi:MAG: hypothetical protein ACK50V_00380 [Alphaproteobacteria bacterium]|jgi:hypothetical protein